MVQIHPPGLSAPMVKRISRRTTNPLLEVRVLLGARGTAVGARASDMATGVLPARSRHGLLAQRESGAFTRRARRFDSSTAYRAVRENDGLLHPMGRASGP